MDRAKLLEAVLMTSAVGLIGYAGYKLYNRLFQNSYSDTVYKKKLHPVPYYYPPQYGKNSRTPGKYK